MSLLGYLSESSRLCSGRGLNSACVSHLCWPCNPSSRRWDGQTKRQQRPGWHPGPCQHPKPAVTAGPSQQACKRQQAPHWIPTWLLPAGPIRVLPLTLISRAFLISGRHRNKFCAFPGWLPGNKTFYLAQLAFFARIPVLVR